MSVPALPLRAVLMLGVLSLVWGTVWPLIPVVVGSISVWTFRAVTMLSSALLLLWLARLRGQSIRVPREYWGRLVASALCFLAVWNIAAAYSAVLIPSDRRPCSASRCRCGRRSCPGSYGASDSPPGRSQRSRSAGSRSAC